MIRTLLLPGLAMLLAVPFSPAADWARFRGPNGDGIAEGTAPLDLADAKNLLWKVEVPGKGVSSPIVVGGKIYLQSATTDGKKRMLICLSAADGKQEWSKEIPGGSAKAHPKNSLASGTPASDGKQVYCVSWDGAAITLNAFTVAGEPTWTTPLGSYASQHGPGHSPALHGGLVFVNVDQDGGAVLKAFDAATGKEKWSAERKAYRANYSTPSLIERPGKPVELLLGTTTAVTSYEPATGKVNWNYAIPWPEGQMPLRVVGHPVVAGGLVICYCGDGGGSRYTVAIDPAGKTPVKVWELKKETPYVPCMLVKGDLLFWVNDKSFASCADAKTGKVFWTERLFTKDVSSSPIMIGEQILILSESGEVAVYKAAKEFELLHKTNLGEAVFATPAVADGKLFIRGSSHLFCYGKK